MTRSLARGVVGAGMVAMLGALALPAAHAEELDDYLTRAAEGHYGGRRVVATLWEGESRATIEVVEHSGDMTMIDERGREALVGAGRAAAAGEAVALEGWSSGVAPDRYTAGIPQAVTRLGRDAWSIDVREADRLRARIVFDAATWAPLSTEIFDGSGHLFRYSTFTDFTANPHRVYEAMRDETAYDLMPQRDATGDLPATAGGYRRADVYEDGDGVAQGFYSDGLFSFSVFAMASRSTEGFEGARRTRLAGRDYRMVVNPTEVWVQWSRGDTWFVLVGDLPPDHLEQVLADLPAPDSGSLLSRMWRSLFG